MDREPAAVRPILATMNVVRRAGVADIHELLVLIQEFYALNRHEFHEHRVRHALVPLLSGDQVGQVWVMDSRPEESTSGYAVVTWGWSPKSGGRDALLDELYVRERGAGLGRTLLIQAMAAAVGAGARRMFLETERHNRRVRRFYAGLGFATEDSVWMSQSLDP